MLILRVIGWLLIVAALIALGRDIAGWIHQGHLMATPAGKLWYDLSPGSLNLAQAVIERHVWKKLWDPVALTLLLLPVWLDLAVPGLLLAFLARRPRKRRRFGRS